MEKAVFWLERAIKLQKDLATQYAPKLDELKRKLEETRKKEGISAGKHEKENDDKDGKDDDDGKPKTKKPAPKAPPPKPPRANPERLDSQHPTLRRAALGLGHGIPRDSLSR